MTFFAPVNRNDLYRVMWGVKLYSLILNRVEYFLCWCLQLMRALEDLPSLEQMEHEQDIYGITYGNTNSNNNTKFI